jgi:hypothetical protein
MRNGSRLQHNLANLKKTRNLYWQFEEKTAMCEIFP